MEAYKSGMPQMRRVRRIHFVGIGGIGMSGIAEILVREGYEITGSDLNDTSITQNLKQLGVQIYQGHRADFVRDADVVVISSAIQSNNIEIITARERRIPIVPRAQMLAELMRFRYGIAVAGTHGKTTTTSLLATLLAQAKLDPTFVIGGRVNSMGTNAYLGSGQHLVVEADESDASFLHLHPMIAVVTNIDADHMSTYNNDFDCLKQAFLDFLHQLPFYGLSVLCLDDLVVKQLIPKISRPILTYGVSEEADVRAINFCQKGTQVFFDVVRENHAQNLKIQLNLPGQHNMLNALAAITIATELGVSDEDIMHALKQFQGVNRRFQQLGEYQFDSKTALVIDDYGHHPKEIMATYQAAKNSWPDRRIVMVFQPHRYSRTRDLMDEFAQVLSDVDALIMLDVYAASEIEIPGADADTLCERVRAKGKVNPVLVSDKSTLYDVLCDVIKNNDVLISQGAGDVSATIKNLLK
ncbi:MAG: UDP-N-acetylmuramate--L-alanine ligase [Gammaproteobacteria bacterium RIFCSPHIGHO2_02_FULL_42_13]|nr:MAG: UDP-N-acetylmuramate--L-alanine ligase [Gammaproteobacteria bacterium RIFCSPHIGHO2_02_FULL_42_13]OGT68816.1 MAG: UDP-N-acetylmuramate--L-alanine ligase [Gammaproteobacteria bacterium RIFCSPLOWO2_02_FULL_42_9]